MITADRNPLPDDVIDEVIARHPDRTGDVLSVLEELQQRHPLQYLPAETQASVARKMGVAQSQIFSVVSFYAFFNRQPQGRHTVAVCRGTACHTRGSKALLDSLKASAGFRPDDSETNGATSFTTPDHRLTIRTVACFGQCALAPVAAIDETIHGHITDIKLRKLVAAIEDGLSDGAPR